MDTFPYSGTTTSCDAFRMSTPIVTMNIKNRHVCNVTTSMLMNMNCDELIAHSFDEYIDIAVALANDKNRLSTYKNTIRNKFVSLMDAHKFAKEFDDLLISIYKEECSKL